MSGLALRHEVTQHIQSLKRYALVLTRNLADAEDLVQDTLVRALASIETFRLGAELRPWLFRIMHNTYVSNVRYARIRANRSSSIETETETASQPASQHERLEAQAVLNALLRLPENQREAIVLIALNDLRYADAARILNIPLGTFMSRIARGREALRRMVDGQVTAVPARAVPSRNAT